MPASNGETLPWKLLHQLAPGKLRISSDGVLPTSRFPDIESSHVPTSPKHSAPIGHSSTPGFSIAETAFIIFFWYLSSAVGNNLNKEILSETVFPFPVTITLSQFGFVVFFSMIRFAYFGIERQRIDRQMLIKLIVPLCISQVFAHLFTEIAVQRIPVSFVHTVKASSPLFAILLTFYYRFSEQYSVLLVLSIVLTMSGVALSSLNEANFNLLGFCAALASTLIFCWQNAFSKKIFVDKQLDHHNLLFYTSFSAFCFLVRSALASLFAVAVVCSFGGLVWGGCPRLLTPCSFRFGWRSIYRKSLCASPSGSCSLAMRFSTLSPCSSSTASVILARTLRRSRS
eukprot:TRINITY_DN396_c0_g2_i3.p1 TRINITY_DN396_c0_g2~~TRINITY_DN396_c0_g2_i3.p1  ORF type:complete len:378 (-),score=-5.99 TRINITY_DN396_c0_g2_i3:543-1568(-)